MEVKGNQENQKMKLADNTKVIEDKQIRNIKSLFVQEECYYNQLTGFVAIIILVMKAIMVKIKPYHSKNTLMKLNHI